MTESRRVRFSMEISLGNVLSALTIVVMAGGALLAWDDTRDTSRMASEKANANTTAISTVVASLRKFEKTLLLVNSQISAFIQHTSKGAHDKQAVKTAVTDSILNQIRTELRGLNNDITRLKSEVLAEVRLTIVDQRWRRGDMEKWISETKRNNPGWRPAPPTARTKSPSLTIP